MLTGKQVMPIDTVYRILWVRENHPEIIKNTYKWLLIEDYINFMLCGAIATDYSMASCTELFDQKMRKWSDEILSKTQIDEAMLPEPMPSGTVLGNISKGRRTGCRRQEVLAGMISLRCWQSALSLKLS